MGRKKGNRQKEGCEDDGIFHIPESEIQEFLEDPERALRGDFWIKATSEFCLSKIKEADALQGKYSEYAKKNLLHLQAFLRLMMKSIRKEEAAGGGHKDSHPSHLCAFLAGGLAFSLAARFGEHIQLRHKCLYASKKPKTKSGKVADRQEEMRDSVMQWAAQIRKDNPRQYSTTSILAMIGRNHFDGMSWQGIYRYLTPEDIESLEIKK